MPCSLDEHELLVFVHSVSYKHYVCIKDMGNRFDRTGIYARSECAHSRLSVPQPVYLIHRGCCPCNMTVNLINDHLRLHSIIICACQVHKRCTWVFQPCACTLQWSSLPVCKVSRVEQKQVAIGFPFIIFCKFLARGTCQCFRYILEEGGHRLKIVGVDGRICNWFGKATFEEPWLHFFPAQPTCLILYISCSKSLVDATPGETLSTHVSTHRLCTGQFC